MEPQKNNPLNRRRAYALIIFVLSILFLSLNFKQITNFAIPRYLSLKGVIPKHLTLSLESFHWHSKGIQCKGVYIQDRLRGYELKIDELLYTIREPREKRRLILIAPRLALEKEINFKKKIPSQFRSKISWNLFSSVQIIGGQISLAELDQMIGIESVIDPHEQRCEISFNESSFVIQREIDLDSDLLSIEFEKIQLENLQSILHLVRPQAPIKIKQGEIEGWFKASLASMKALDHIAFDLHVKNLDCEDSQSRIGFTCPSLDWKNQIRKSTYEKKGIATLLQGLHLKNGEVWIQGPKRKNRFIAEISAGFNRQSKEEVEILGRFVHECNIPFESLLQYSFDAQNQLDFLFNLHASDFDLKLNAAKKKKLSDLNIEFYCKKVPLKIVDPLLQISERAQLALCAGNMSGQGYACFSEKEMKHWGVDGLSIQGLKLVTPQVGAFHLEESILSFEAQNQNFPKLIIKAKGADIPSLDVSDCCFEFVKQDFYLSEFALEATILGQKSEISASGPLNQCKIDTSIQNIAPFLQKLDPSLDPAFLQRLSEFAVAGQLNLLSKEISADVRSTLKTEVTADSIDWNIKFPKKINRDFLKALRLSAKGKNISQETMNLFLQLGKAEFSVSGVADVDASLIQGELSLNSKSHQLGLHTPVVQIQTPFQFGEIDLHYDMNQKSWHGGFNVQNAQVFMPQQGLHFHGVSGQVRLEDLAIHIQELQGRYGDLLMEGLLFVQFGEKRSLEMRLSQIAGSFQEFGKMLRHFDDFEDLSIPFDAHICCAQDEGLRIKLLFPHEGELESQWTLAMHGMHGLWEVDPKIHLSDLQFKMKSVSEKPEVIFKDVRGLVTLGDTTEQTVFGLKADRIVLVDQKPKIFDLAIETATHSIIQLAGTVHQKQEGFAIEFDPKRSNIYGEQFQALSVGFSAEGIPKNWDVDLRFPVGRLQELFFWIPSHLSKPVHYLKKYFQGSRWSNDTMRIFSKADLFKSELVVNAEAEDIPLGEKKRGKGELSFSQSRGEWELSRFALGELHMSGRGTKQGKVYQVNTLEGHWGKLQGHIQSGIIDLSKNAISLEWHLNQIPLNEWEEALFPEETTPLYLGQVNAQGKLNASLNQQNKPLITTSLVINSSDFSPLHLPIKMQKECLASYSFEEGLKIQDFKVELLSDIEKKHWATVSIKEFVFQDHENYSFDEFHFKLPPELLNLMRRANVFDQVVDWDIPSSFQWENLIDCELNFLSKQGDWRLEANFKDGYYWLGEKSYYLKDLLIHLDGDRVSAKGKMRLIDQDLELELSGVFQPKFQLQCLVSTIDKATGQNFKTTLKCLTSWNQREGYFIQSVEGELFGLKINLHHTQKNGIEGYSVLSGSMFLFPNHMTPILSEEVRKFFKEIELGNGVEISGDLFIKRKDVLESKFEGFVRGKNVELFGSRLQTLLGQLAINKEKLVLNHFKLTDQAGIFQIPSCTIEKKGRDWELDMPEVSLQDFRPSLLRKIGRYRGKIKPLVVRELKFERVHGTLGKIETITGEGVLQFMNTFKKEYNLLDIPYEIIARVGFDMGLWVPIKGKLSMKIDEGKIFLVDLMESHSEGKRSKFYLSQNKPSYIGLDGSIDISIKMKQYVILKVTEPFILSISGNVKKPKYSLR